MKPGKVEHLFSGASFPSPFQLGVLSRIIAASLGGYVLINLFNLALGLILPGPRYQDLLFAMMISFFIYTAAIIWVFAVRTATKAWLGLAVAALPPALIDLFFLLGAS